MKVFTTINPESLTNIYFITDDAQKYGVLIDPGSFALNVYKLIQFTQAEIKKVIITHNESTQVNGIPLIKKIYDIDIFAYNDKVLDQKVHKVKSGNIIKEGELEFKVIGTPIHSYDSISILSKDIIFVGDILEAGTLSSFEEKEGPSHYEYDIIKKNILNLPDYVIIYPGKGPATTVGIERKFNPYFKKISNEK